MSKMMPDSNITIVGYSNNKNKSKKLNLTTNSKTNLTPLKSRENNQMDSKSNIICMNYDHLYAYNPTLKRLLRENKLSVLRNITGSWNLPCTGKKLILGQRIIAHIKNTNAAKKIQRIFRGHIVRLWLKLKYSDKKETPVNDTDFYTMEPIKQINVYNYFHYISPDSNTNYVFSLESIMNMIVNTKKLENPYTRESMNDCINVLKHIVRLTNIVKPDYEINVVLKKSLEQDPGHLVIELQEPIQRIVPALPLDPTIDYAARIRSLFANIDLLGFYTNANWFTNLTALKLFQLIQTLLIVWHKIPEYQQKCVCPTIDLFSRENLGLHNLVFDENNLSEVKQNLIAVIVRIGETLITNGQTNDDRYAGASYFLTALTLVSYEACEALPWLYDNFQTL